MFCGVSPAAMEKAVSYFKRVRVACGSLREFRPGLELDDWMIWSIGRFRGWRWWSFWPPPSLGECPPWELKLAALYAFPRVIMLKVHTITMWDTHFGLHLVKLGTQAGWGCRVLMSLGGGAYEDFPSVQLDDPLLGSLQNFYLYDQLMIYLCYCLTFTLRRITVDGEKFSFTIDLRPVLIQLSLQIDTAWTSCPRESTVGSNSSEESAPCREVLLCAMIAVRRMSS